jgi:hypothetical protein
MRYRPLSAEERNIMEHATAWRHKSNPLYRNRYVIDPDCDSWGTVQGLCERGLMRVLLKPELDGMTVFAVTTHGMEALRNQ